MTAFDCVSEDMCQSGVCDAAGQCSFTQATDGMACQTDAFEGTCQEGRCVGCLSDTDCTEPARPVCVDDVCVSCRVPADCEDGAMACTEGRCLYCDSASDCDDQDPCTFDYCARQVAQCRHPLYEDCVP